MDIIEAICNIVFPLTPLKVYLFVCFIILMMFISVKTSRWRIFRTYRKYMKIPNKADLTGGQIAATAQHVLGLNNLQFALVDGKLTDGYSSKHKTILISKEVYYSNSLSSMAIIAHEFGHALQDAKGSILFNFCKITGRITKIFNRCILPSLVIGIICTLLDFFSLYPNSIGIPLIILAGVLLVIHFLFQLITIPMEYNASARAMKFLKEYNFISDSELRKVRKLLGVAAQTYIANFLDNILPSRK